MTIIRNGNRYELTDSELREASEEYEIGCRMEDIKSKIDIEHLKSVFEDDLSDEEIDNVIKDLAYDVDHRLTKSDGYFEEIWNTIDAVIKENNYKIKDE